MRSSKITTLFLIGLSYTIITWFMPVLLPDDLANILLDEDSIIEYWGALSFFLASILFLVLFFQSKEGNDFIFFRTPRNLAFLFLALLLFFGAGEEISWGQRIIGFETPEAFSNNVQGEFTIHNESFLDTDSGSPFRANRLFIYFWFAFGILVPVAAFVPKLKELILRINIPLVPMLLGSLFLINYIASKLYEPLGLYRDSITEIRETQQATVFLLVAIFFWLTLRENAGKSPGEAQA